MNRNKFLTVLLVMLSMMAMVFVACDDDNDEIKNNEEGGETILTGLKLLNNREVDGDGGTFFWAVKAAEAWTLDAASLPGWLKMSPLKGGRGTTGVVMTFAKLTDVAERTAELSFKMGGEEIKIAVKQTTDGNGEEVECKFLDSQVFGVDGGELKRGVLVSADWTVKTADSWLTVSPTEGTAGETVLTLTAGASDGDAPRVAVLSFDLGDTILELAVVQGLNQTRPALNISDEVVIAGRQATMTGGCEFKNDELTIEEVGFACQVQGANEWTNYSCAEVDLTATTFSFSTAVLLEFAQSYSYKPYAKLGGEYFYGEPVDFTIEAKPSPADGVWFYENFDGMYNSETKVYTPEAIAANYGFTSLSTFEFNGGFLRKNQPAAVYKIEAVDAYSPYQPKPTYFRCNMADSGDEGKISAMIKPDAVRSTLTGLQPGEGTYAGASGNWKFTCKWMSPCSFIITGLDFDGAGSLELTFGYYSMRGTNGLKVFVSTDGKEWSDKPLILPQSANNNWRHIKVELEDTVTAIKIEATNGSTPSCLDDIKVVEVP